MIAPMPDDSAPATVGDLRNLLAEAMAAVDQVGADQLAYREEHAARLLGIERWRLRDARRRKEIRAAKCGKVLLYPRSELLAFLARGGK